jgi:uncharacterized membrane protein
MSLHDSRHGIDTDARLSAVRDPVGSVVYRHPLAGRIVGIEAFLLSLAVVAALVGTRTQTHGVGLSGLLIVTAMVVAVVSVAAAVAVALHRGLVALRRAYSPV